MSYLHTEYLHQIPIAFFFVQNYGSKGSLTQSGLTRNEQEGKNGMGEIMAEQNFFTPFPKERCFLLSKCGYVSSALWFLSYALSSVYSGEMDREREP